VQKPDLACVICALVPLHESHCHQLDFIAPTPVVTGPQKVVTAAVRALPNALVGIIGRKASSDDRKTSSAGVGASSRVTCMDHARGEFKSTIVYKKFLWKVYVIQIVLSEEVKIK
jgi:hypothetical protein